MIPWLDIDTLLAFPAPTADRGIKLGVSRQGRDILGYRFGNGPVHVSLIAGCHADEPTGPAMLDRLVGHLAGSGADTPLLKHFTFFLVPHVHPDGEVRNRPWTEGLFDSSERPYPEIDLGRYLEHVVRDPPGEDVEFGFPRSGDDQEARPENRAVAEFLAAGAPFVLHASWHGMAFAAGPWFLMEASWADRTYEMRRALRRRVRALGYRLHDIDRGGDKGFHRIDEGFTTRPDSRAMIDHFRAAGDERTARLFRPSSMEFVRGLGGDPLTLVSEMPLFLTPAELYRDGQLINPPELMELRQLALSDEPGKLNRRALELGARPMPTLDQMRLQLEFLEAGLQAVTDVAR